MPDGFDFDFTRQGQFRLLDPSGAEVSKHTSIEYAQEAGIRHAIRNAINGDYTIEPPTWSLKTMGFSVTPTPGPDTPPSVTQTPAPVFVQGTASQYFFGPDVAYSGVSTLNYALSGTVDPSLTLDPLTGVLSYDGSGAAQQTSHQLTVSNAVGSDQSASFNIDIQSASSTVVNYGPLPNLQLLLDFVTGAPQTYTVNDQAEVGGSFTAQTLRDAMNSQLGSGGNREIQYEPGFTGILARDLEAYLNTPKTGTNVNEDGYSSIAASLNTANDAEWDVLIGKHLNNVLTRRASTGNVEQYYMPDTMAQCRVLGIDAVGHANLSLQSPAGVTYTDVETKEFNAPGSPLFAERIFSDTYTDANGVVQMKPDNDIHDAAQRSMGNFCRAVGNKLIQSDYTTNTIGRDHRYYGYGQTSGSHGWIGASAGNQQFPGQFYTGEPFEWAVPYIEGGLWRLRGHHDIQDNPAATSPFADATNSVWPTLANSEAAGYRFAPFIVGPMSGAAITILEGAQIQGNVAAIDAALVGTNGQSSLYQVLEDFLLWAETSTVHPLNSADADQPMFTLNTDSGSGYKQFRFQDRTDGRGTTRPDAISMWMADAYAWCGKQRALGNAALGVTKDVALSERLMAVFDQCFADAVTRKPFLQAYFGGFERKELGEIWNGCLRGWFWRLEAQGIITGRRFI